MNDCEHVNIVRVVAIPPSDGLRKPQDGVYTYYCKNCHLTLYVQFTDAPPIVVTYGRPAPHGEQICKQCGLPRSNPIHSSTGAAAVLAHPFE